jgi:hypothetical protein
MQHGPEGEQLPPLDFEKQYFSIILLVICPLLKIFFALHPKLSD